MTYVLGLTGSIGMGKSTTAAFFAEEGIPVWDADATVRALYAEDGAATQLVAEHFPDAIENGSVSRPRLRDLIADDPTVLDRLQDMVHPLVAANRRDFIAQASEEIVLLDIPLLFETGADAVCDGVVVVSVPADIQRERVLARGEMTAEDIDMILSRQMPDAEKRSRATWIIETVTLDEARQSVKMIIAEIRAGLPNA